MCKSDVCRAMLLPTYTSAAGACGRIQDARNCSMARVRCGKSMTADADANADADVDDNVDADADVDADDDA